MMMINLLIFLELKNYPFIIGICWDRIRLGILCNGICLGACNIVTRAINTFLGNAIVSL